MLFKDKIINKRKKSPYIQWSFEYLSLNVGGFFWGFEVIAQENKISKTSLLLYKYFWIVDIWPACI